MSGHQAVFPIRTMACLLGISPAGYSAWRQRQPSRRVRRWMAPCPARIPTIHAAPHATYGAPRILAELRAQGQAVGLKRVARLMRAAGLAGVSRRKGVVTTRRAPERRPAPGLVERNFTAARPDQLWVADIT